MRHSQLHKSLLKMVCLFGGFPPNRAFFSQMVNCLNVIFYMDNIILMCIPLCISILHNQKTLKYIYLFLCLSYIFIKLLKNLVWFGENEIFFVSCRLVRIC